MKALTKYLSTKPNKISGEFPENPTYSELIKFLKNKGFEEVIVTSDELNHTSIYAIISSLIKTENKKVFISLNVNGSYYAVRFFKTGIPISKENNIFLCRITENGPIKSQTIENAIGKIGKPIKDFSEFRDLVNKYFNW